MRKKERKRERGRKERRNEGRKRRKERKEERECVYTHVLNLGEAGIQSWRSVLITQT